jgi:glycosyltransferase involved in cell wall biosynthesis
MKSVFEQSYNDFEYIIIDGGSNDGSKDLIESNSKKLSYWVSEKDNGIYNAMNKGTLKAKGEYVLYLNSGDYLVSSDVLKYVSTSLNKFDIIFGDLFIETLTGEKSVKKYNDDISFSYFINESLPHPASFISKNLLKRYNYKPYNEELIICSDWLFFLISIFKKNASIKHIPIIISNYNLSGISSNINSRDLIKDEKFTILNNDFKYFLKDLNNLLSYNRLFSLKLVKLYLTLKKIKSWV